jgi:hypothetical protein
VLYVTNYTGLYFTIPTRVRRTRLNRSVLSGDKPNQADFFQG